MPPATQSYLSTASFVPTIIQRRRTVHGNGLFCPRWTTCTPRRRHAARVHCVAKAGSEDIASNSSDLAGESNTESGSGSGLGSHPSSILPSSSIRQSSVERRLDGLRSNSVSPGVLKNQRIQYGGSKKPVVSPEERKERLQALLRQQTEVLMEQQKSAVDTDDEDSEEEHEEPASSEGEHDGEWVRPDWAPETLMSPGQHEDWHNGVDHELKFTIQRKRTFAYVVRKKGGLLGQVMSHEREVIKEAKLLEGRYPPSVDVVNLAVGKFLAKRCTRAGVSSVYLRGINSLTGKWYTDKVGEIMRGVGKMRFDVRFHIAEYMRKQIIGRAKRPLVLRAVWFMAQDGVKVYGLTEEDFETLGEFAKDPRFKSDVLRSDSVVPAILEEAERRGVSPSDVDPLALLDKVEGLSGTRTASSRPSGSEIDPDWELRLIDEADRIDGIDGDRADLAESDEEEMQLLEEDWDEIDFDAIDASLGEVVQENADSLDEIVGVETQEATLRDSSREKPEYIDREDFVETLDTASDASWESKYVDNYIDEYDIEDESMKMDLDGLPEDHIYRIDSMFDEDLSPEERRYMKLQRRKRLDLSQMMIRQRKEATPSDSKPSDDAAETGGSDFRSLLKNLKKEIRSSNDSDARDSTSSTAMENQVLYDELDSEDDQEDEDSEGILEQPPAADPVAPEIQVPELTVAEKPTTFVNYDRHLQMIYVPSKTRPVIDPSIDLDFLKNTRVMHTSVGDGQAYNHRVWNLGVHHYLRPVFLRSRITMYLIRKGAGIVVTVDSKRDEMQDLIDKYVSIMGQDGILYAVGAVMAERAKALGVTEVYWDSVTIRTIFAYHMKMAVLIGAASSHGLHIRTNIQEYCRKQKIELKNRPETLPAFLNMLQNGVEVWDLTTDDFAWMKEKQRLNSAGEAKAPSAAVNFKELVQHAARRNPEGNTSAATLVPYLKIVVFKDHVWGYVGVDARKSIGRNATGLITAVQSNEDGLYDLVQHFSGEQFATAWASGTALGVRCKASGVDFVALKKLTVKKKGRHYDKMVCFIKALMEQGVEVDIDLAEFWKKHRIKLSLRVMYLGHFGRLRDAGANVYGLFRKDMAKVMRMEAEARERQKRVQRMEKRKTIAAQRRAAEAASEGKPVGPLLEFDELQPLALESKSVIFGGEGTIPSSSNPLSVYLESDELVNREKSLPPIPLEAPCLPAAHMDPVAWRRDTPYYLRIVVSNSKMGAYMLKEGEGVLFRVSTGEADLRREGRQLRSVSAEARSSVGPRPMVLGKHIALRAKDMGLRTVYLRGFKAKKDPRQIMKVLSALGNMSRHGLVVKFHIGQFLFSQKLGSKARRRFLRMFLLMGKRGVQMHGWEESDFAEIDKRKRRIEIEHAQKEQLRIEEEEIRAYALLQAGISKKPSSAGLEEKPSEAVSVRASPITMKAMDRSSSSIKSDGRLTMKIPRVLNLGATQRIMLTRRGSNETLSVKSLRINLKQIPDFSEKDRRTSLPRFEPRSQTLSSRNERVVVFWDIIDSLLPSEDSAQIHLVLSLMKFAACYGQIACFRAFGKSSYIDFQPDPQVLAEDLSQFKEKMQHAVELGLSVDHNAFHCQFCGKALSSQGDYNTHVGLHSPEDIADEETHVNQRKDLLHPSQAYRLARRLGFESIKVEHTRLSPSAASTAMLTLSRDTRLTGGRDTIIVCSNDPTYGVLLRDAQKLEVRSVLVYSQRNRALMDYADEAYSLADLNSGRAAGVKLGLLNEWDDDSAVLKQERSMSFLEELEQGLEKSLSVKESATKGQEPVDLSFLDSLK